MTEEESRTLLKHLSNDFFCKYVEENIKKNNEEANAKRLITYLNAINSDMKSFKTTNQEKLSAGTIELVKNSKQYFLNLINEYEEIKRTSAKEMMNKLNNNIGKEVIVQYWQNKNLETKKVLLTDINDFGFIITDSGTMPFLGYKTAIYKIDGFDGLNRIEIYHNPNIADGYVVNSEFSLKLAKEDIFGEGYDKELNKEHDEDQTQNQEQNSDTKEEKTSKEHINCPYCNTENEVDAEYCSECGNEIKNFEQYLSTKIVREYYAKQIDDLNARIKEQEDYLNNSLKPKKADFVELAALKKLRNMLNENCEYFINNLYETTSQETHNIDTSYREKLNIVEDLKNDIEAETNERKKKRIESRKNALDKKIGDIEKSQRKIINRRLNSVYIRLQRRAEKQADKIGEYDYKEDIIERLENRVDKIEDKLDDNNGKVTIRTKMQELIKKLTQHRIKNLRKKQGKLDDKITENKITGDEVHFAI